MRAQLRTNPRQHWTETIPVVTYGYNAAVHQSTGKSPAEARFGTNFRLPVDNALPNRPGQGAYTWSKEWIHMARQEQQFNTV